jgi:hypothetical protein
MIKELKNEGRKIFRIEEKQEIIVEGEISISGRFAYAGRAILQVVGTSEGGESVNFKRDVIGTGAKYINEKLQLQPGAYYIQIMIRQGFSSVEIITELRVKYDIQEEEQQAQTASTAPEKTGQRSINIYKILGGIGAVGVCFYLLSRTRKE